jgi:putative PIN family toxin of toxin-antitoxin system
LNLVLSRYILDEMVRVLPRLARIKMSPAEIRDLADSFTFTAEIVEPTAKSEAALRDRKDQPILGTLLAAHADYLVTGDKDLLALAGRYPIVTPAAFWERHGS